MKFAPARTSELQRLRNKVLPFLVLGAAIAILGSTVIGTMSTNVAQTTQREIALGIWVPETPWDLSNLDALEEATGKRNAIVNFFWSWDDAQWAPDTSLFERIADRGSVPMVTWMPQDYRFGADQPNFRLSEILSGRYDSFIVKWASALAAYERPVLMRFGHEMNGNWYPWGAGVNGNTPEQFVAVWRHIHKIFEAHGADNVNWVWAPNVENADPALFFPGDDYIDWVGLSAYNNAAWGVWRSFSDLVEPTYNRVTSISSRPVMIAEVGTSEGDSEVGGSKTEWIHDLYEVQIPQNFPRIAAVLWFNENKYGVEARAADYSLTSSSSVMPAYIDATRFYSSTLDSNEKTAPSPEASATSTVVAPTVTPEPTATPRPRGNKNSRFNR